MAGGAGGIKAGRAYVEIGADDSQFQRALKNVEKMLGSAAKTTALVGASISAAGAAILAPLGAMLNSFESTGSALNDMSARTGLSVERLGELSYAANQTGSSIDEVEGAFRKAQKVVGEAATGSDEAAKKLEKLGISVASIANLSPDEQFELIASSIASIKDPTVQAAATLEIFGKSGTKILPLIKDFDTLSAEANALGGVMSTAMATNADNLGDSFGRVRTSIGGVVNQIGNSLAPIVSEIADRVARVIAPISQFVAENRQLVVTVAGVGVALVAVGGSITGFAGALKLAQFAASGLSTVVSGIVATFGFLLSPLGLAIGLIGSLATVILVNTDRMGAQIDFLGERFATLGPIFKDAFDVIVNLLASGQFGAAGKLAWAGLELAFQEGAAAIKETWASVWRVIVTTVAVAMAEVDKLFAKGAAKVQKTQQDLAAALLQLAPGLFLTDKQSRQLSGSSGGIEGAFAEQVAKSDQTADIDRRLGDQLDAIDRQLLDVVDAALGDEAESIKQTRDGIVQLEQDFARSVRALIGNGPGGRLSTEADAFAGDAKKPFVPTDLEEPSKKVARAIDDAIKFASPVSSFASLRGSTAGDGKMLSIADRQLSELKGLRRDVRDINTGVNVT